MSDEKQVALTSNERELALYEGYNPDMDFKSLSLEATYVHMGFTLVEKEQLIGVPMIIIGVTYRLGIPRNDRIGDYVSVEAVCGGPNDIRRNIKLGLLDEAGMSITPNMPVVFNDGSTGLRRQLTGLLQDKGMINVGPVPEDDENLVSRFDRPYQFWIPEETVNGRETEKALSFTVEPDGQKIRWLFFNGLRKSEYEWTPGKTATTFYIG